MIITQHGMAYSKVQVGDVILSFNPVSRDYDSKAAKFGADVALVSLNDGAFNGVENATFGAKEPFLVKGPGEYEVKDIFIRGFASEGPGGMINTVYSVMQDGIRICHLGGLAKPELKPEAVEGIGVVDVLFVPVGGNGVLGAKDACKIISMFEPKIVIPTMFDIKGDTVALKTFLKECGEKNEAIVDKLSIKKKDLEGKDEEIIVIKS